MKFRFLLLFVFIARAVAQLKIVGIVDESLAEAGTWLANGVTEAQAALDMTIELEVAMISIEDETTAENKLCASMATGTSLVLDITAGGWNYGMKTAKIFGIPYVHSQVSIYQHMAAVDELMQNRNATDAALVFSEEDELDQALYYLVEGSSVRVIVLVGFGKNSSAVLKNMRPSPAHYVLFGSGRETNDLFNKAVTSGFVTRDSRWTVVITGTDPDFFRGDAIPAATTVTLMSPANQVCCTVMAKTDDCECSGVVIPRDLIINSVKTVAAALKSSSQQNIAADCKNIETAEPANVAPFITALQSEVAKWPKMGWNEEKMQMMPSYEFEFATLTSKGSKNIGDWTTQRGIQLDPSFKNTPIKRFFKIGSIQSRPWFYKDPNPGDLSFEGYSGYCVELALRLSQMMEFEFSFHTPEDGKFGGKMKNGTWNGLVADLANGMTDMVVAPLTMTSEREEVIDFVAPYFDQSGISIVIRKRERKEHLFKFLKVLKVEVWFSIIAALVITGIMLWLLDRYSPYSAQNNSEKYAEACRKFTLKESFWFALTSFTPQGGGEAPKTPVSSLEELAGQSKINYTVVKSSAILNYFKNMAGAEEELYRVWKELTLNSTTDQSKYRVWDYPIKEQYTHILQIIDSTGPVDNSADAFKMVLENTDGELAFIHDAAEIRYEIYQNCFLLEVGEPFAEQPYAIAVQQGSYLQEEISRAILELQKERYFESLLAKFWNSSAKGDCPNNDDSEGITLQSLGGVFIATLIGLLLALIALAGEVLFYRKGGNNTSQVEDLTPNKLRKFGESEKMALPLDKEQISRINVAPVY